MDHSTDSPPIQPTGSLSCTPLICVAITTVLLPRHQALQRSAGSTGTSAYNEVVEQSRASMYIETDGSILVDDGKDRVPCILPLPADVGVLVVRTSQQGGVGCSRGDLLIRPITKVRYVQGDFNSVGTHLHGGPPYRSGSSYDQGTISSLVFSGYENVITIGNFFLVGHVSLVSLDIGSLHNVTSIGSRFMVGCSAITSIDLRPLRNVTTIESGFMGGCSALTEIDVTPLSNAASIGDFFMWGCTSLATVDITPLRSLTAISRGFMKGCTGLTSIHIHAPLLQNLSSISDQFMEGCSSLEYIDFGEDMSTTRFLRLPNLSTTGTIHLSPQQRPQSHQGMD